MPMFITRVTSSRAENDCATDATASRADECYASCRQHTAGRPCADLWGWLMAQLRMLAPVLADVLVVPLLAHDEVMTRRHLSGNTLWFTNHALDEVWGELVDSDVIHE